MHTVSTGLQHYLWFAAGLFVLTALTVGLGFRARVGLGFVPFWALARAVVQLTAVALLLRGSSRSPGPWRFRPADAQHCVVDRDGTVAGALARAAYGGRRHPIGALVSLVLIFALHLVAFQVRYLIALGGIIIGNAMTAATLAGRNFLRGSRARSSEVEAWLSLGATPAQAHEEIGREAVRESLLPNLDQTRSTGLVTLPGAFVGALFGGASPAQAAQFQLVVLAGIALTMMLTGIVVTQLAGRTPLRAGRHRLRARPTGT